jgi:hypothetical protein
MLQETFFHGLAGARTDKMQHLEARDVHVPSSWAPALSRVKRPLRSPSDVLLPFESESLISFLHEVQPVGAR